MSGNDNTSYTTRTVAATGATLSANDSVLIMTNTAAKAVAVAGGASAIPGRQYTVVNAGATGNVTITPSSGTIDGGATYALLPGIACTIINDGTNWILLSVST